MNVVGYKGNGCGDKRKGVKRFYLNVVGYKAVGAITRDPDGIHVLFERSGI